MIDTINPVVSVDYANTNVRKNVGDHKYFNDVQKATIQIKEHNFRADDVVAKVTAKNVSGENVKVPDYAAYLSDRSNWQKMVMFIRHILHIIQMQIIHLTLTIKILH